MPILDFLQDANAPNSHDPAGLGSIQGAVRGCGGCPICGGLQTGGYRFRKTRSKRSRRSRRRGHGVKSRRKVGCGCGNLKKRGKKQRTRRRKQLRKHKGHSKRRMRGGNHLPLNPGSVSENISLPTSYEYNNVPASFGYSLGGNENTDYGSLANPPPHARYEQCPGN